MNPLYTALLFVGPVVLFAIWLIWALRRTAREVEAKHARWKAEWSELHPALEFPVIDEWIEITTFEDGARAFYNPALNQHRREPFPEIDSSLLPAPRETA